jgi:predicted unusual protein kinase regulating ubiquinone biosynthesis (AarF/ABC1/UbiB family)
MKSFGLYRIVFLVTMAVKFFMQVYLLQRKWRAGELTDASGVVERMLAKQATEFRRAALKLEGLTIKVGQFLSTRADVMPQVFTSQLKDLVDRVPPAPWPAMKRILLSAWNVPLEQVLLSIEPTPIASASIADVYRAVLRDGTTVAVKIRRPNVLRLMRADFTALKIVLRLAKRFTNWGQIADLDALYRDFVTTTERELDFRLERKHSERFREMIERLQLEARAPLCYEQWSTEQVLVMEWVDGMPISDQAWLERHHIERDPLIQRLIDIFFAQIFSEGFFHADPHPGNLLVSADGTLHVIDFGMMGTIRDSVKQDMKLFLQGFIVRDAGKMATAFEGLGFLRTGAEPLDLQTLIKTGTDFFLEKDFSRVDEQTMVEMLAFLREYVARNPLQLPAEFAFLGRAISILSGVLAQIKPQIDYLEAVKPAVEKWLNPQSTSSAEQTADDSLFSFGRFKQWGVRGLTLFNEYVLPRVTEWANLPNTYEQQMVARNWNDYYSKRQMHTVILTVATLTMATTLYIFEGALTAALPAGAAVLLITSYIHQGKRWQQKMNNATAKNNKERVQHE